MNARSGNPVTLHKRGVRMSVRVVPRAKADRIEGFETDGTGAAQLKVRIKAPPEDGRANAALVKLLAKHLKLPASAFHLHTGAQSRNKVVEIDGNPDELLPVLRSWIKDAP